MGIMFNASVGLQFSALLWGLAARATNIHSLGRPAIPAGAASSSFPADYVHKLR